MRVHGWLSSCHVHILLHPLFKRFFTLRVIGLRDAFRYPRQSDALGCSFLIEGKSTVLVFDVSPVLSFPFVFKLILLSTKYLCTFYFVFKSN